MTDIETKMKLISWTTTIVVESGETRVMAYHIVLSIEMHNNLISQRLTSSSSCRCSKVQQIVMEAVVRRDKSTLEAHQHNKTTNTIDNRI